MRRLICLLLSAIMLFTGLPSTFAQGDDTTDTTLPDPGEVLGRQRVDQAMLHLSGFLELETPISLQLIEENSEDIPFVSYTWVPFTYTTSAMGCPASGVEYSRREVPAYRILLTVRGFGTYDYRVSQDGSAVILCFGGRPNSTSIGLELSTGGSIGIAYDRDAINSDGLVGALARVDQAMRNISDVLNLTNTITYLRVRDNDPAIASTQWAWLPVYYVYDGTGCPDIFETFSPERTYGYQILLTVNERDYTYYANVDGTLLIRCVNGNVGSGSLVPQSASN